MANYHDIRAFTLGSQQEEEAVTVNTRALIDKVLARYSSENTTLRELLQNAADAGAQSVEVRFETTQSSKDPYPSYSGNGEDGGLQRLPKMKVNRLLVKNDGQAFREEDWQRLKRIAEGNPDETKIGAFGVGFYSVFADCEEPFVSSGNQAMAFYWKGNSLYTRRAKLDKTDPFTTFFLEYREPTELPDLRALCKFFATSLTFVRLDKIALYVDNVCLLTLNKKASPPMPMQIPNSIRPVSYEKMMSLTEVTQTRVQIDAKYMNITHYRPPAKTATGLVHSFFSKVTLQSPTNSSGINSSNIEQYKDASIFLRIATGKVATKVGPKFAQELERATKKPPPQVTTLAILTMSKDEQDASEHESEIFENVVPSRSGKIFIGFPTHQTTSICAHISAQSVIPTVERENIDLNARIVKTWNIEMLRMAGILARVMYTDEMAMLQKRADGLKPQDLRNLYDDAVHIMRQFTFLQSTPSASVGAYIGEAFWTCTKSATIELLSTKGVLPSNKIRLSSDVTFLEGFPILAPELVERAPEFVKHLKEGGLLTEMTISDIQGELITKALSAQQSVAFMKWLAGKVQRQEYDSAALFKLLGAAVAMLPATDDKEAGVEAGQPLPLGDIQYYVNISKLAANVPVPSNCIPFSLTQSLSRVDLEALGWSELNVVDWIKYITAYTASLPIEHNIDASERFAQQTLVILSKSWDTLSQTGRDEIVDMLGGRTCMPTRKGMKLPRESYFSSVKLFSDLPIVTVQNVKDRVLSALGVRKTVELKLVFDRLMNDSPAVDGAVKWSHVDLIRYLTSVRDDIPADDIRKLRNTAICKAEGRDSKVLHKVSDLYEPDDSLRKLKLPLLQWPGEWRTHSQEAKFLQKLGLRKFPTEAEVLKIASNREEYHLQDTALRYFIDNYHINGYSAQYAYGVNVPFLPLDPISPEKTKLVNARQCYANPSAAILGFNVIRRDIQHHADKFGVKTHPDMRDCVERVTANPPDGPKAAREQFGYLATRLSDLPQHLADRLGHLPIVPTKGKDGVRYVQPTSCYLGSQDSLYAEVFTFVDFGTGANAFLMKCGSKPEPTSSEVAYMVAREPERIYRAFQSEQKYLGVLRLIAQNWTALKKDKDLVRELKASPCLGAYKEFANGEEDDDGNGLQIFEMAKAEDIVIIDEYANYTLFRKELLQAPQEETLETFYISLGAFFLSTRVQENATIGARVQKRERADAVRKLVLERTRLFLHNNGEPVRRDLGWLESHFDVQFVKSVKIRKSLRLNNGREVTHMQESTATVGSVSGSKSCVLFLTESHQLYDIATAMIGQILQRPKPHSTLLLDTLLGTDLYTLKARGYNVNRILKAKQAEAKLLEQERLQKVEEERKALAERENKYQEQQLLEQERSKPEDKIQMPGAFANSPEQNKHAPPPPEHSGGFLSRGFSRFSKLLNENDKKKGLNSTPSQPLLPEAGPSETKPSPDQGKGPIENKPTEPHRLASNLHRAIQSGRSHDSSSMFSKPQTYEVKEEKTFCDNRPAQDLVYAAQTPQGIKFYFSRGLYDEQKATFFDKNLAVLNHFANMLEKLATEVFSMNTSAVHVYYDPQGSTIAFNSGGALFFNIRFFLQLHNVPTTQRGWNSQGFIYWFVVACHELAHNLVSDHGSQHSFYAESFVQEYFEKSMKVIIAIEQPTPGQAAPAASNSSQPPPYDSVLD